jgi:hypothetical protein
MEALVVSSPMRQPQLALAVVFEPLVGAVFGTHAPSDVLHSESAGQRISNWSHGSTHTPGGFELRE